MISCNEGNVKINGTAIELIADFMAIGEALLRTLDDKDPVVKDAKNMLIKNFVYTFTRSATEKGFSTSFSDEDLGRCKQTYEEVYGND